MKKLMLLCCTLLSALANPVLAQFENATLVSQATDIPWEKVGITNQRFVLAGEMHHVSCIYPFQLSQIEYLVKKGFRHLVWEMPFSVTLVKQDYLDTGADSVLRIITGTEEEVSYWKGLYQLNQSLPVKDRIHLWGIDHELGDNVGGTGRLAWFKLAMRSLQHGRTGAPEELQTALSALANTASIKEATELKHQLKDMLTNPAVAGYWSEKLLQATTFLNRLDYYKVLRNDEMLKAFTEICNRFGLDSNAKFLGRFGWGHTDKSYKQSMSWHLQNDPASPVKGSTFIIGVHYLNCTSSVDNQLRESDGIIHSRKWKKELASLDQTAPSPIKLFTYPSTHDRQGWVEQADALFVFSGFPALTPRKKRSN